MKKMKLGLRFETVHLIGVRELTARGGAGISNSGDPICDGGELTSCLCSGATCHRVSRCGCTFD